MCCLLIIVRGKHLVIPKVEIIQHNDVELNESLSLNQWQSVSWFQRSDKWVIKAIDFEGQTKWLDAASAEPLEHLSKVEIASIATSHHANQIKIAAIYMLKQVPFEVRHLALSFISGQF